MKRDKILLAHGSGGELSRELIEEIIYPIFDNNGGQELLDSAFLALEGGRIAMTTDSYVISPLFFPGGDIGKLAACGTINDLAVCGAIPKFLSVGLIIEEGFPVEDLKKILRSLSDTAASAGVLIVTGDTKVVERGSADKIFINTTGIGIVPEGVSLGPTEISVGDLIIISGMVGDHGMAVLCQREGLSLGGQIASDCAPLSDLAELLVSTGGVSCMRDPTRGGVASVLYELARQSKMTMEILNEAVPVHHAVAAGCSMLGLDPLYLANEGKLLIFARPEKESEIMNVLRNHPLGRAGRVIGRVTSRDDSGKVLVETELGAKRILPVLEGEHLPRIC
ncbi:hydrogenase [Desulforamulus profundi]|uniref:Hydrogenase n=1 Tax=Desulforamulus profundi TaxID=1383067 RepID=A0A2C6M8W3_9FIRM|nr:hydrogenase expression/formation protein HypE [Desulforamulus profundi]PHJ37559.1 hydrogenase [Desulforamulus profundi]